MASPTPSPPPDPLAGLRGGDEAFVLVSSALVFMMVPALAFFYGGMVSARSVVHTMMLSFTSLTVGALAWSLYAYSLAFGPGGPSDILGNFTFGFFDSSDRLRTGTHISEHAFFIFQLAFNTITVAVISGAVVERIRMWAFVVFSVVWTTIVYCPLARWVFYPQGWLAAGAGLPGPGVLDFAGGLVVETASGVSAFVLAYWLGPGKAKKAAAGGSGEGEQHHPRPHNLPFVLLGAGFLAIGWFGFNAGSSLSAGYLTGRAFTNTHLAASAALGVWGLCEITWGGPSGRRFTGTPTALGAATAVVVGLVGITPACGYVSQMASLAIGALCALASYWAVQGLKKVAVDDRLECLPCHGVAGALGILLTGLFASTDEGSPTDGAFYGNPALLGSQAIGLLVTLTLCVVGTSVAFGVTAVVGQVFKAPLRIAEEHQGNVDDAVHGESAYWHESSGGGHGGSSSSSGAGYRRISESEAVTEALLRSSAFVVEMAGAGGSGVN